MGTLFYLKCECLVESGFKGLSMDFSFKLFLFVREQIEFNIGVRTTPHIHGRELCSLQDPYNQLEFYIRGNKKENLANVKKQIKM